MEELIKKLIKNLITVHPYVSGPIIVIIIILCALLRKNRYMLIPLILSLILYVGLVNDATTVTKKMSRSMTRDEVLLARVELDKMDSEYDKYLFIKDLKDKLNKRNKNKDKHKLKREMEAKNVDRTSYDELIKGE